MNYNRKVVVITGASSGIGEQSAEKFAQLHAIVVLVSRNEEKLQQISSRLSKYQTTVLAYACDISKKDQVDKMVKFVIEKFGGVDVLVNNAGFGIYETVEKIKVEEM
ncbi:MAG: SDR family NAD(P)-dependent oxidoreductase, partial [Thaumarchaeota archaeon]|nr:SDR family NAD(P)-dependent oxidoreductase [Nitrososphaerota archaeon]